MLDIGLFELMLIAVVGLFVIGPERLPSTIRTCALWFGRIKRNLLDTRKELEKHIGADEIRRELQNEQVMHNIAKMKESRDELAQKIQDWKEDVTGDLTEEEDDSVDENDPYGDNLHHDDHDEDLDSDDSTLDETSDDDSEEDTSHKNNS